MQKLIILGTGGNCVDILDTVNDINQHTGQTVYECVGFLDDNKENWGKVIRGIEVLGPLDSASVYTYSECVFVNGIGSPFNFWKKKDIISKTQVPLERFSTIVHPSASVSIMANLGQGVVVFQNVTVTSNVTIGNHVIILPNTVISHDDFVGDYTCITGGVCISGGVTIGNSCYVGTNSAIIGNISIGDYCLIGMGSVVISTIEENSVVIGNPARLLRRTIEPNP
jgi:sugar O-acyltransferase (sialic acid O-acetyltransferase NeuD family)